MRYQVLLSEDAENDFNDYINFIENECKAPATASKHYDGIINVLLDLEVHPAIYVIQTRPSLAKFGHNVRRINYKKMAIIYTIHGNVVYIHRIMPGASITGL
jgi:plasmid stabilization system protein ParE